MYLWIKAAHVVSVFIFTGGLVLLVVVTSVIGGRHIASQDVVERLRSTVHRWDKTVTLPSLLVLWFLGFWLALDSHAFLNSWMQVKFAFVLFLSGLHGVLAGRVQLKTHTGKRNKLLSLKTIVVSMIVSFGVISVAAITKFII